MMNFVSNFLNAFQVPLICFLTELSRQSCGWIAAGVNALKKIFSPTVGQDKLECSFLKYFPGLSNI
jgi:hypothetical protein